MLSRIHFSKEIKICHFFTKKYKKIDDKQYFFSDKRTTHYKAYSYFSAFPPLKFFPLLLMLYPSTLKLAWVWFVASFSRHFDSVFEQECSICLKSFWPGSEQIAPFHTVSILRVVINRSGEGIEPNRSWPETRLSTSFCTEKKRINNRLANLHRTRHLY